MLATTSHIPPGQKLMLIAGEASGDTLGAELVSALRSSRWARRQNWPPYFFGAGGAKMQAAGVDLALDLTAHSVVGIWEVLRKYSTFRRIFKELLALASARQPEVVILIDYPGFNLRFARALRKLSRSRAFVNWQPKVVFYVSPQIWAWHESRVYQIARDVDLMLSIFPFEKKWYAQRVPGFQVEFIGHPLVDRYRNFSQAFAEASPERPLVLLLPGSRERELRQHLPVMVDAWEKIQARRPVQGCIVVPEKMLSLALSFADSRNLDVTSAGLPEKLRETAVALASSGTVTMECAYFGVPTVVIYKTSPSTYFLGRRFIKVPWLAMPNLLAGEMVYPEFIQQHANPDNLAAEAIDLLNNPARRDVIKSKLKQVVASLGVGGASARAAESIIRLVSAQ